MIRVLIAEDIVPVSNRYARILTTDPDIDVIGQVETGSDAVQSALSQIPDVILMDVEMETRTAGLDASREILSKYPHIKIIILTVYEDDETVFQAFQLGVSDYFLKNSPPDEIISCVKDAYQNLSPIRPVIAKKIRDEFQRMKSRENGIINYMQIIAQLTQTELDILNLIHEGYSRQQICEIRCVELSTVKTQIHNILKKFNKNSMHELVSMLDSLRIFDYLHQRTNQLEK